MSHRIRVVEQFARSAMETFRVAGLKIAHDYKHVDRVRHWAVQIADGEAFPDRDLVEAAALLHDIGLATVERRADHAPAGAEQAAAFLSRQRLFAPEEIAAIAAAIAAHSSLEGGGTLGAILRDADMLDLFGAVGITRALMSQYAAPDYPAQDVKGETWAFSADDFTVRFRAGRGAGAYAVDHINFQLSCVENLTTMTARQLAAPLVSYMRAFLLQLETEIVHGRSGAPAPDAKPSE